MPDRIADHYERHADAFDRARRERFVERAWFDRFLIGVRRGGEVLDLGCGAGEPVARFLVDKGYAVTGVDASETMLGLARIRFPRHQWLRGDMRSVSFERRFDGVLAWDSFFHLPAGDQAATLERMAGWLAVGGMMMFNTGPAHGVAMGEQFGDPLFHASLDPADYRAVFARTGLAEVAFAPEDPNAGGRSVWLARKIR
ncbi:class I SAM-dependent methyltransferase [Sphingomonas sp.]|uniref:class I SAM-dependent methyltransferase n=1 Tax=Sphingomonas sp. TaxID=28214 RepID=UPI001B1E7D6E|nr:class I SAM-dependent methyltransferase [Sphingomonas sp.]MBO9711326.1 class I SAM-dependent methyltransferase [Sphingomonas sp.]